MPEQPKDAPTIEPIIETREKTVTIKIDPADEFHYSNVASITVSPWDIRLNFADVDMSNDEGRFKAHHGIVMPPEHAAALMFLLTQQLRLYENQFGPIRQSRWRKMVESAKLQEAQGSQSTPDESTEE